MDKTKLKQMMGDEFEPFFKRWTDWVITLTSLKNKHNQAKIESRMRIQSENMVWVKFENAKTLNLPKVSIWIRGEKWEDDGNFVWGNDFEFDSFTLSSIEMENILRGTNQLTSEIVKKILS